MRCQEESYSQALEIMRRINWTIGAGSSLTDEEKKALNINGRVQTYLNNRLERGDEVFQKELAEAGKSTREFDNA